MYVCMYVCIIFIIIFIYLFIYLLTLSIQQISGTHCLNLGKSLARTSIKADQNKKGALLDLPTILKMFLSRFLLFKHIVTQCVLQEFQQLIEGDYTEPFIWWNFWKKVFFGYYEILTNMSSAQLHLQCTISPSFTWENYTKEKLSAKKKTPGATCHLSRVKCNSVMSHVTKITRDLSAASVLWFTSPVFDIVFNMHRSEKEMRRKRRSKGKRVKTIFFRPKK